jgi:dTDP-4-amino-4,6-dideoxygalactose transaminase
MKFSIYLNFYLLIAAVKIFFSVILRKFSKYPDYVSNFEKKISIKFNSKYAITCSSGSSACLLAIKSLGLKRGDYCLLSKLTFPSTVINLLNCGLKIVYLDFDYNLNAILNKELIKKYDVKLFVISHLYGLPKNYIIIQHLLRIVPKLKTISDCSHAHGAKINGINVVNITDVSFMSLQGNKAISGGEGGVCFTNSSEIYKNIINLGHPSKRESYALNQYPGANAFIKSRMHPLGVLIADAYLKNLDNYNDELRNKINYIYNTLRKIDKIATPAVDSYEDIGGFYYGIPFFIKDLKFNIKIADNYFIKKFNYPKYEFYESFSNPELFCRIVEKNKFEDLLILKKDFKNQFSDDIRDHLFFIDINFILKNSITKIEKNLLQSFQNLN